MNWRFVWVLLATMPMLVVCNTTSALGTTNRASLNSKGREVNGADSDPTLSADARFVAFRSAATNLVPRDTNGKRDIFVRDLQTGQIRRVSVNTKGTEANGASIDPSLSADGRFVAFSSAATNLVPGDTNGAKDIFVHDRQTRVTNRVSLRTGVAQARGGSYAPVLSGDGRLVAFQSDAANLVVGDTNRTTDIFVRDRLAGRTTRVSVNSRQRQAKGGSFSPAFSGDGRFVAFQSEASNLVARDTNQASDIFVHDRRTGATMCVSLNSNGVQANGASFDPALSADGRFVAFRSFASNLVPGDTNERADVFVRDRRTGKTLRMSVNPDGTQTHVGSFTPALSADGRFLAFRSSSANLVPRDTNKMADIFVYDLLTARMARVSVSASGKQANLGSFTPALSADGRFVAFYSYASNLVNRDINGQADVFIRNRRLEASRTDLALSASDRPDPSGVGKPFIYRFAVSNQGPNAARNATLIAVLPSQAAIVSATPSRGVCNRAAVLVCRLGVLAKKAKAQVEVKVKVTAPATLQATASVFADQRDQNPNNNRRAVITKVRR